MVRRGGAATFGDATGEYLALRTASAYVRDWYDLLWVRGPDAVTFLEGLVSQAVEGVEPGSAARSLLLSPQGKLRAPHVLLRGEDEVGLITDAGVGETAAADLRRFKIRVDASIEPETGPVVGVWGPTAAAAVASVTGIEPELGWRRHESVVVAAVPVAAVAYPRFVVVGEEAAAFDRAGVSGAGTLAADAVRIEAGEPIMGVDIDERTIPQEAGLVADAVDFTKGCYLGQELVARIDSRGHVNRQLRGLVMASNVLPPPGAEVVRSDAVVGSISSVAESLELRAPVGLALVRREVAPDDAVVVRWEKGEAPATVRALPLDSFEA